jgi:hypothetical protein
MIQNEGGVSTGLDKDIEDVVFNIFMQENRFRPKAILEFGTYLGLGTTLVTIRAIERAKNEKMRNYPKFYTVEANETNYNEAKKNLREYPWVEVIHGTSVGVDEAIEFIKNDELLLNQEAYPIKVDAADPIPFYISEIKGELAIFGEGKQGEEKIFDKLIKKVKDKTPLFILDSCGGIGWLEFSKIMSEMEHENFFLFLHDIDHIKHWRSYKYIIHPDNVRKWDVLGIKEGEWVLVKHRKKARKA